ncbi:MAG: hypothetical protein H6656_19095 [Ardenticatenaceae bacterium]|nr:hypothetical protein [Ardenticatenaceae bacterium]
MFQSRMAILLGSHEAENQGGLFSQSRMAILLGSYMSDSWLLPFLQVSIANGDLWGAQTVFSGKVRFG